MRSLADGQALLRMRGIWKRFPGVTALSDVSLRLNAGEVLGLIGENGAGKSTLMSILGGILSPDRGEVLVEGQPVPPGSVARAISHGVSIIHQELDLAPNLDVASNILLGREPMTRLGLVDRRRLLAEAGRLAATIGLTCSLTTPVEDLPAAQQQLVEIAKALSVSAKILVLDEPTSSLSSKEASALFSVMASLKRSGVSMIYISHRLHEVQEMCDRVVVLRDGRVAGELDRDDMTRDRMVRLMVGRDIPRMFPSASSGRSETPALSVESLVCEGCKGEFTFSVYPGEVLGIAGLVGSGRTELVRTLFGVRPARSGQVLIEGRRVAVNSVGDAVRNGMGFVPEDRKDLGLLMGMTVSQNLIFPGLPLRPAVFLDRQHERSVADEQVKQLSIKVSGLDQNVENLSGGNQQKVTLGKWMALSPKVLILDEPTRGIDVGSKSEIYSLVRSLADNGMAVLMVSSEMEEIVGLADRTLVMHEGRLQGVLERSEITEESIMNLATGGSSS